MHPEKLYSSTEFEERQKILSRQRVEILEQYPGLDKKIRAVFSE